jgi:hypothetical protein
MNSAAALRVGAEFSFSEGATTVAEAIGLGYAQLGNIIDITPELTTEKVEAEDSNRGSPRVVRSDITKTALKFKVKSNEFTKQMVKILFGGEDTTEFTQSAQTAVSADTLAFGTTAATIGNWYPITVSSARIIGLTTVSVATASAATGYTVTNATNVIAKTSHGHSNGDALIMAASTAPGGTTNGVTYYVRDASANDFKLAATAGGAVIDLTTDGTSVAFRTAKKEGTDFEVDLLIGRIRFLTAQSSDLTPVITAAAVTAGSSDAFFGLTPGQTYEFNGYGALYLFDQNSDNSTPLRWEDFSCQVTFDSAANINAKSFADMTFTVLITDDVGTQHWRNSLADVT